jgi:hypothetical protein
MKVDVAYPFHLYNSLKDLPKNNAFPCSVLFNDEITTGIMLTCSSVDLDFFNLKQSNSPQPDLKLRMINFLQEIYLIEIQLIFSLNKILKIHLNPVHQHIWLLMNLLIEKQMISFHFYDMQTGSLASTFTSICDEDMDWVLRNVKLINGLNSDMDYLLFADFLSQKIESNERLYKFNGTKSIEESFIGHNSELVKFID